MCNFHYPNNGLKDLDAPHRGKNNRSHLTHDFSANYLVFSRVRSECGEALLFIHHDLLEFQARAIWMLSLGQEAMMQALSWDMARHRQTVLRTALRGSHAALALAFAVRDETSATWLGKKVL